MYRKKERKKMSSKCNVPPVENVNNNSGKKTNHRYDASDKRYNAQCLRMFDMLKRIGESNIE